VLIPTTGDVDTKLAILKKKEKKIFNVENNL
jgi:hypothetical protein